MESAFDVYFGGQKIEGVADFTTNSIDVSEKDNTKTVSHFDSDKSFSFDIDMSQINQYGMMRLFGYKFVESDWLTKQVRVKKHKQKRINKKWLKKYGMKYVPDDKIYIYGMNIVGHSKTIKKIIKQLDKIN